MKTYINIISYRQLCQKRLCEVRSIAPMTEKQAQQYLDDLTGRYDEPRARLLSVRIAP